MLVKGICYGMGCEKQSRGKERQILSLSIEALKVGSWRNLYPQPDLQGQLQLQPLPQSAQREGVPLFTVHGAGKQ